MLLQISIHMEFAIYIFLFLILFLGVLFNLKITNTKRINEIREKFKKITTDTKEFNISK